LTEFELTIEIVCCTLRQAESDLQEAGTAHGKSPLDRQANRAGFSDFSFSV
jgi:hypothetical protein